MSNIETQLRQEITSLKIENQRLQDEVSSLKNKLHHEKRAHGTILEAIQQLQDENSDLQKKNIDLQRTVNQLRAENHQLVYQVDELNDQINRLMSSNDSKTSSIIKLKTDLAELTTRFDQRELEHNAAKNKLKAGQVLNLYKWCVVLQKYGKERCKQIKYDLSKLPTDEYKEIEPKFYSLFSQFNEDRSRRKFQYMLDKRNEEAHLDLDDCVIDDLHQILTEFCRINNIKSCDSICKEAVEYIKGILGDHPFDKQNQIIWN